MNGFDLITQGPRAFGVAALIALASPPAAQDRQDTTFIITEGDEIGTATLIGTHAGLLIELDLEGCRKTAGGSRPANDLSPAGPIRLRCMRATPHRASCPSAPMGSLLDSQGVMIACRLTGGEVIREGALRFLHTLTNGLLLPGTADTAGHEQLIHVVIPWGYCAALSTCVMLCR